MIVFPGAGIVGKEKSETRLVEEVAVDSFELVRQRGDIRHCQCRHVVLHPNLDAICLDAEPEPAGVTIEAHTSGLFHHLDAWQFIE